MAHLATSSASAHSVTSDRHQLTRQTIAHATSATGSVVSPANLNSPDQTVISGTTAAVHPAPCRALQGSRRQAHCPAARQRPLPLLPHAARPGALSPPTSKASPSPRVPIPSSPTSTPAAITRAADARDCLIRQVTGPVRWVECIRLLVELGATHFFEIGPGRVLSGLMRQIDRTQTVLNVEDRTSRKLEQDPRRHQAAIAALAYVIYLVVTKKKDPQKE